MKEYFEKHETLISILLIIVYILSNSYCINYFGITDYRTTIVNYILVLAIIAFIIKNKLGKYYGLTSLPNFKKFLYFIPLIILVTVNLWAGIKINNSLEEIIFYILSMIAVGFLEEIIFRGFLFKMMEKENLNMAIIVTSLTFGFGHILNLFNGAEFLPTLIQICYATAGGYLFVIIFQKGKSLWPCIIAHAGINSLSIFSVQTSLSIYIIPIFLIIISVSYAIYINKVIK